MRSTFSGILQRASEKTREPDSQPRSSPEQSRATRILSRVRDVRCWAEVALRLRSSVDRPRVELRLDELKGAWSSHPEHTKQVSQRTSISRSESSQTVRVAAPVASGRARWSRTVGYGRPSKTGCKRDASSISSTNKQSERHRSVKRTLLSPKSCLLLSSVLICHCRRCGRRCVLVRFLSASYGMYDAPLKTPQNFLAFRIARLSNSQAESQSCQSVKQEYQVSS